MAYTLAGRKGGTVRFEPLENGIVEKESESYSSTVILENDKVCQASCC